MDNKGQYLLYDALFALILIFLIITTVLFVIENNDKELENPKQYKLTSDMLEVLKESPSDNNHYLLSEIAYKIDHNESLDNLLIKVSTILNSNENINAYTFSDTNSKKILLDTRNKSSYKNEYSGFKSVDNHIFQLIYYKN